MDRHDRTGSRAVNYSVLSGNDPLRLVIVDDGDFYDVAFFRNFAGRCGDPGAERGELLAALFAQVANRQLEAGSGDVCGHGLSHGAEADKANLGFHKFFLAKELHFL